MSSTGIVLILKPRSFKISDNDKRYFFNNFKEKSLSFLYKSPKKSEDKLWFINLLSLETFDPSSSIIMGNLLFLL